MKEPVATPRQRRSASMCALLLLLGGSAHAQVAAGDARVAAAVTAGTTVGHETAGSLGAEGVFRIDHRWALFVEGGYLWNVVSPDVALRAERIATVIGAEADVATRVAVADAGIRVRWPVAARLDAYAVGGAGVARVRQETVFSFAGSAAAPETRGVQLGTDLRSVITKPVFIAGGGIAVPVAAHSFVDLGVRYTRIIARPSKIPHDRAINAVRVQAAVGLRF